VYQKGLELSRDSFPARGVIVLTNFYIYSLGRQIRVLAVNGHPVHSEVEVKVAIEIEIGNEINIISYHMHAGIQKASR
jgi:hypothetical protein